MESCEWCGKPAPEGTFFVTHGYSEGAMKVGACCGVRDTGLIRPEHAGPLLKKKDHSQCCGYTGPTPYADFSKE